jgi:3-isopropylmalate/(R)-2-methylmalate dehydratase large subunit
MGFTIAEKILARVALDGGPVYAGQEIRAKPDFVMAYDFPGYLDVWFRQMRDDYGIERVREPHRFAMFIDHMVPGSRVNEEQVHAVTRAWCRDNDVALYERAGIGHHVAIEQGYAVPGSFSIHFDGHTSQLGAYGALSIGVHKQVLEALISDTITVKVPRTTRVNLHGRLQPGVMARDVFHHLVRELGPAFCRFQVLELGGPAIEAMSFDARQAITCLAMFAGAITAIINPGPDVLDFSAPIARTQVPAMASDPDADYSAVHDVDISDLAPVIVRPPSPAATRDIADFVGLAIDMAYIGSCSSGRIEDLRAAAHVLRGRRIHNRVKLNIVPTSQAIYAQAAREGLLEIFAEAGAFVTSSTCDLCYGYVATLSDGQRAVSTGTLNTRGRMGSPDSEIYLCSAATVAASALAGSIADPRAYFTQDGPA